MRRLLIVVAALGCGGEKQRAPSGADPWATDKAPSIPKPLPVVNTDPFQLVVNDRGAEPRRVEQYKVGSVDRELRFVMVDDDHRHTVADMRYRWKCAPCSYRMISMTMGEDRPPELDKDFEFIAKHIHGEVVVPADGHVEVKPATMMTTTPSTIELLEVVTVVFPKDAIGVGARWTVTEGPETKRFTLTSRTDQGATVALAYAMKAPSQALHAEGTLAVTFADPVARGVLKQTQTMSMPSGGDDITIKMTITAE